MFKRAKALTRNSLSLFAALKPAESAQGIGQWLDSAMPYGGRVLCASRAGKPGTVAQDRRRATKKRNQK